MDSVWWTRVTNASHFLDRIVDSIQEGQSVLLQLPGYVPWYETMRNKIETELLRQNSTSFYRYVTDSPAEPGEYLFQEFCKKEKRAHYRPGIGYAEFLAKSEDIVLNECILWIKEDDGEKAKKWYAFAESYIRALGKHGRGCVFLLETRSEHNLPEKKGIKKISLAREIEHYDKYLFNMLAVSGLKGSELFRQYLAEAVSVMLPDDIELSAACIAYGRDFLENPVKIIRKIIETKTRSDGTEFGLEAKESEIRECLWEAQMKVIFPLIEKHRNSVIRKYRRGIDALLPIQAAYGEVIEDADDVELGTVSYLAASGRIQMSEKDLTRVTKLKNARNALAHIGILSQDQVDEIFAMDMRY